MPTTPYMSLLLPTVSVTLGPLYASENNIAFTTVDSHDHSPGKGAPISSSSLIINSDLSFSSSNATNLRSINFINNGAPLSLPGDVGAIYSSGGNLYYNNAIGQQIQLTSGGSINVGALQPIGGDYGPPASLFYTSLSGTYTFWQNTNTPGLIDSGPITIRPPTAGAPGIKLQAPLTLATPYAITFPLTLPSTTRQKILTVASDGIIQDVLDTDETTIEIISNTIRVKALGITATQLANNTITATQIVNNTITATQIANATITQIQVDTNFVNAGTYIPTPTDAGGTNTLSASTWQWLRIGNTVTLSGQIRLNTNPGVWQFNMNLPINGTRNFTNSANASGTGHRLGAFTAGDAVVVNAIVGEQLVQVQGSGTFASGDISLNFTYQVIP